MSYQHKLLSQSHLVLRYVSRLGSEGWLATLLLLTPTKGPVLD